jgi:hypothetical protein
MGSSKTGLVGTVGVTLLTSSGTVHTARATTSIYEIGGGCYGKNISFPDNWAGSIKWDTGGGSPVYACEEYAVDGLVDMVIEDLDDIKGTGFVKDSDSLVDIRPETDKIQTGIINVPSNFKADTSGLALSSEYDATLSGIQADLDNPDQYKANVSNLDVAVSTRSSHGDPTSAIKGSPGKTNQEVYNNERGTDSAYTGTPPTSEAITDAILNEPFETHTISGTYGKLLNDVFDEAFGKWVLDPTVKTLTLYKSNGVTILKVFDLTDTATNIPAFIARIPQ